MKFHFYLIFVLSFFCIFTEATEVRGDEVCKEIHLFPVAKNGKIGFIDQTGKLVIPCEYTMYTRAGKTNQRGSFRDAWQIANEDCLKQMDEENSAGYFYYLPELQTYEGIIPIVKNGKIGFLREDGTIIVQPQYAGATSFTNGRAWVSNEKGEYLFIDDTGKVLMDKIEDAGYDRDDQLPKMIDWRQESFPFPVKKGGKWGFIDRSGKLVIPCQFDKVGPFETIGLASVTYQGKEQMIDKNGTIFDYQYKGIRGGENNLFILNRQTGGSGIYNDKKGWVTRQIYGDVGPLSEGLRWFRPKDSHLYGYMDEKENVVIPPQFNYTYEFHNGLARIGMGYIFTDEDGINGIPLTGKWGYVNKQGKMVWEPSFGPTGEDEEDDEE